MARPKIDRARVETRVRKGAKAMVRTTGKALETGVKVTENVARGLAPMAKTAYEETKKGAKKAKEKTLKVAKDMEKW